MSLVLGSWIFENQKREIVTFLRRILEMLENRSLEFVHCSRRIRTGNVVDNLERSINVYR